MSKQLRVMHPQLAFPQLDIGRGARERMRPFLKWAGGKYLVLDRIFEALPPGRRLVEPFTGSAVVAINAPFKSVLASDTNSDLIELYNCVKRDADLLLSKVRALFSNESNTREVFDRRRHEFNASIDPMERSSLFIYLNRHCFNGLCRYNARGMFNVPFGKYKNPLFPENAIVAFSRAAGHIEFRTSDFRSVMSEAQRGDVVYCDPPYVPLSSTANFTGYATDGFDESDQVALAEEARKLAARGIPVIISNHDTSWVRSIYAGAKIESFPVQRRISRDAATRGAAQEVLAIFQ